MRDKHSRKPILSLAKGWSVLAPALLAVTFIACSGGRAGRVEIRPVVFDLEGMDAAVANQLQAVAAIAKASPVEPEAAEAWGVLGETCHAYGLRSAATDAYTNAIGLAPDEPRWWYLLGTVAAEENLIEDAVAALSRAADLAPDRSAPVVAMSRLEVIRGNSYEAARLAHRAIEIDEADMGGWLALAEAEVARDRVQDAVDAYRTIIQRQPEASKVIAPLVGLLRRLGLLDKARDLQFRSGDQPVVRRDPWMERVLVRREDFGASIERAARLFENRRYVEAANGFEAALAMRPDDVPTMVNFGGCLLKLGEFDAAAEILERAVELDPKNPIAWFDLGSAHVGSGHDEAAVAAYERSVSLRPGSVRVQGELGDALRRLERWEEALSRYRIMLEDEPTLEPALAWGGVCLVRLERFVEARSWFKSALRKQPQSTALAGLASRLLATAEDSAARDGDQALKVAQQLEQIVAVPIHLELVSLALAETGNYVAAIEKADEAIAALPEGPSELRERLERERLEYSGARPFREFGRNDLFVRDAVRNRVRLAGAG